jgi:hypothetical protein
MKSEIKQYLEKLSDPSEFKSLLWGLSKNQKREGRSYVYKSKNQKLFRVYRACCFSSTNELPHSISRLSYNPSPEKTGRCNRHDQSIFYSSAGLPTTFVETKNDIVVGSIVVVSEWHATDNIVLQQLIGSYTSSLYEELMKVIFTEVGDKYYSYSAEIFNHLVGADCIDGLIYPSIASQNNNENVAFKKAVIDQGKLVFWNAKAYRIKNIKDKNKWDVDEIDFALSDKSGNLTWSGEKGKMVIRQNGAEVKAVSNGWSLDFYDEDDNLLQLE